MIVGHGIDLQEISKIQQVYEKNKNFVTKVLTAKEQLVFADLMGKRQLTYLAGRWSAKEAFSKAYGTGIEVKGLRFQDLEILSDAKGAPYFSKHPFSGSVYVSISHSGNFVQASVILEEEV